jgi:hypothetical protein
MLVRSQSDLTKFESPSHDPMAALIGGAPFSWVMGPVTPYYKNQGWHMNQGSSVELQNLSDPVS